MQLPPNKPQQSIMKELKSNMSLTGEGAKKEIGTKVIASIEDIPSGWKLVSETHNKKDKFYLDENLLKQGAIVYVDTVEEGKTVQKFYWFIGTQQFTLNARLNKLMEELINNGERVFRSTVKDQRLIEELYKTSKDVIGSTDKDYSRAEKGTPTKEVNDLFLREIGRAHV